MNQPMRSKAVVYRGDGVTCHVEEVTVDAPGANEVMVKMSACGVCHSDLSATNGTLPAPPNLILGHEGAGVVCQVGAGVTSVKVGDPVVSCFFNSCGRCRNCVTGRPYLCEPGRSTPYSLRGGELRTRDAKGEPLHIFGGCGVMAEYATVHENSVVKIAPDAPLESCSLIGCCVMTGWGAVCNTAKVEAGSVCVVFGAGGVGLNALQGCKNAGATMIIAVDTMASKLDMAKLFGATHVLDASKSENVVKDLRKLTGGGADYAFECVGHGSIVEQAYACVRRGGTAVVVGLANQANTSNIGTASLVLEEKTLKGSYYGSTRPNFDFPRLVSLYRSGQLKLDELITRRYSIDEAPQAFEDLAQGRNARGVIVFD